MPYPTSRPPTAPSGPGICRQCWQCVLWTITAAGRRQPVDPNPDPAGRVAVYVDATGRYRSRQLSGDRPTPEHNEALHMAHAATCRPPATTRPGPPIPRGRRGIRPVRWQR